MRLLKLEQHNCNPCVMVSNYLDSSGVDYDSINIEDNPEVAMEYGVMGVPVVILLDDQDQEVERVVGFNPPQLDRLIEKLN